MPTCADDELVAELRRGGERADRAIAALSAELAAARAVQPAPTPAELDRDTSRRLHPGVVGLQFGHGTGQKSNLTRG